MATRTVSWSSVEELNQLLHDVRCSEGEFAGLVGDLQDYAISARLMLSVCGDTSSGSVTLAWPATIVELGKFYRNGLGHAVFIVDQVSTTSKWYRKGYRFIDQRGTHYLADGVLDSKLWGRLSLQSEIDMIDVTDAEIELIHKQLDTKNARELALAKLIDRINHITDPETSYQMARKILPFFCGMDLGSGVMCMTLSPIFGATMIALGAGSMALREVLPETLRPQVA